jgi:Fur family ferric uptake transcriptional regulator
MACEKVFLEKLRERGLRLTPQREMILSTMHEMEGLVTAEAIYAQVQSITSAIDISTVYRTLDLPPAIGADTWPPNRCPTRAALPR